MFTQIGLFGQDRKLTLNLNEQPISSLFKQIEDQCKYAFVYSDEVVSDTMKISINVVNVPVRQVLEKVLPENGLTYQMVSDKLIAIGRRRQMEGEQALKVTINGTIMDQKGNGIPFASIGFFESEKLLAAL